MNIHEYNNVGGKTHQIHVENDDKPSDFRGAPFLDNRKPCFPKVWGGSCNYTFFFPVGPVRKLKMPSQEKNHSTMDVARLGFRKTNVGARKAGLVT